MKNYNKVIYTLDDANLNIIYYGTNIYIKNFKKTIPS